MTLVLDPRSAQLLAHPYAHTSLDPLHLLARPSARLRHQFATWVVATLDSIGTSRHSLFAYPLPPFAVSVPSLDLVMSDVAMDERTTAFEWAGRCAGRSRCFSPAKPGAGAGAGVAGIPNPESGQSDAPCHYDHPTPSLPHVPRPPLAPALSGFPRRARRCEELDGAEWKGMQGGGKEIAMTGGSLYDRTAGSWAGSTGAGDGESELRVGSVGGTFSRSAKEPQPHHEANGYPAIPNPFSMQHAATSWLAVLRVSGYLCGHVPHAGVCALFDPPVAPSPQHHCFSIRSVSSSYPSIGSTQLRVLVFAAQHTWSPLFLYFVHSLVHSRATLFITITIATLPLCLSAQTPPAASLVPAGWRHRLTRPCCDPRRMPADRLQSCASGLPLRLSSVHPSSTPASWTHGLLLIVPPASSLVARSAPLHVLSQPALRARLFHPLTQVILIARLPAAIYECSWRSFIRVGINSYPRADQRRTTELVLSSPLRQPLKCVPRTNRRSNSVVELEIGLLSTLNISDIFSRHVFSRAPVEIDYANYAFQLDADPKGEKYINEATLSEKID
ncbi:hypothetical protein B0H19DRAFT_1276576 [Mycena capillaripes]|nr:hypothetical protein B0H19DRAFT_1276576 [Mycena capillaripes]